MIYAWYNDNAKMMKKLVEQMTKMKPEFGAWVSIGSYIVLSLGKLYIGYMSNSEALKADGWNNFTDILASIAILIGLLIAKNLGMTTIHTVIHARNIFRL